MAPYIWIELRNFECNCCFRETLRKSKRLFKTFCTTCISSYYRHKRSRRYSKPSSLLPSKSSPSSQTRNQQPSMIFVYCSQSLYTIPNLSSLINPPDSSNIKIPSNHKQSPTTTELSIRRFHSTKHKDLRVDTYQ